MSDTSIVAQLKGTLRPVLAGVADNQARAVAKGTPLTVIALPRHGYAATRATVESFYRSTNVEAAFIYLDVMSPPAVRDYLSEMESVTPGFSVVRIDRYVSRQMARLLVLELVRTPYTLFLDNNMLLSPGAVDELLRTAGDRGAAVVSPVIVMQGGNMHFSGARITPDGDGRFNRSQVTEAAPSTMPIEQCELSRDEIDFAESHCCLMRTDVFQADPAHWFPVEMHNAHTIAVTCTLYKRRDPDALMLLEPRAVVSVLPIAFGYDLPWLFESYNRWEYYRQSYAYHVSLVPSVSSSIGNLAWHRKHFLYLLNSLLEGERLERQDLLLPEEAPERVTGYDHALPADIESTLERDLVPYLHRRYPQYLDSLRTWLYEIDDVIENIDYYAAGNSTGNRTIPVPAKNRRLQWDDDQAPVLVDDEADEGIRLNPEAYTVWSLCNGRNTGMDIEKALVRRFPESAREIIESVGPLLRELEALGAITLNAPPDADKSSRFA